MTRIQGTLIIALLAFIALNVAILDIVIVRTITGISESFAPDLSSDIPTEVPTGVMPTRECMLTAQGCP